VAVARPAKKSRGADIDDRMLNRIVAELVEKVWKAIEPYKIAPPVAPLNIPHRSEDFFVKLRRPVKVPYIIYSHFIGSLKIVVSRNGISIKHIRLHVERINYSFVNTIFADEKGNTVMSEINGASGLTLMVIPKLLNSLKTAKVEASSEAGAKWFRQFIETASDVLEMQHIDEIRALDPKELLEYGHYPDYVWISAINPTDSVTTLDAVFKPSYPASEAHVKGVLYVEMNFADGSESRFTFYCMDGDAKLKRISLFRGATEEAVKKHLILSLTNINPNYIQSIVNSFLNSYN